MSNSLPVWRHMRRSLAWFLRLLFEPPPSIPASEHRTVRLLASSTFTFMLIIVVGQIVWVSLVGRALLSSQSYFEDALFKVGISALLLATLAYALSRTRYYWLSIWLLIMLAAGAPWLSALMTRDDGSLYSWTLWEVLALVIGMMFLDVGGMMTLIALSIGGQVALMLLLPPSDHGELLTTIIALTAIGSLMILAQRHKAHLEQDRRQALMRANAQLTVMNRELEQSIIAAQQARALAEEANHLKSEFLALTSHELRTPLNSIIGFTVCVLNGLGVKGPALSKDQMDLLKRVENNSKELLNKINDLLAVSHIRAELVEVTLEPLSPRALLESTLAHFRAHASLNANVLTGRIAPDLPETLLGDAALLNRVLHHLISNAVKFTRQGQIEVEFKRGDGDQWQVAVKDTGIGIPSDALEHIFEPFRQADASFERQHPGAGLGLAIARGSVHLMDGTIHVESTVNVGSTFTVTLPLKSASGSDQPAG